MKLEVGKMWHHLHCFLCKPVSRLGFSVAPAAFFNLWTSSQASVSFTFVHHMWPVNWAPLLSPPWSFEGALSTKRRRENFSGTKAKLLLGVVVLKGGNSSLLGLEIQKLLAQPKAVVCALWSVQREGHCEAPSHSLAWHELSWETPDTFHRGWWEPTQPVCASYRRSPLWDECFSKSHYEDRAFGERTSCLCPYHRCVAGRSVAVPLQALALRCEKWLMPHWTQTVRCKGTARLPCSALSQSQPSGCPCVQRAPLARLRGIGAPGHPALLPSNHHRCLCQVGATQWWWAGAKETSAAWVQSPFLSFRHLWQAF